MADERVPNHRRYLFLKYARAVRYNDDIESVFDAKRRLIAGTELPASFPARDKLIAAGYLVSEELAGSNTSELRRAGLSSSQAAAVIAAIG